MSTRAAEVTECYEAFKSTFMDFIVALHSLNKNTYVKATVESPEDGASATIKYLDSTFHVRLSIASCADRICGIVCTYIHETDKDTPILRYIFDNQGEIFDPKSGKYANAGIFQNTFPKQFIGDLADAYLNEMGKRHIQ